MKKLIFTIVILFIIFIVMLINNNIEESQEIKIDEVQSIENYIKKIYGWKEVTNEALPEFNNINDANELWLWGIIRKNIESEAIEYEQIEEKVRELYGKNITKSFPTEGNNYIKYDEEIQEYVLGEITLDAIDDEFFINKIEKNNNGYIVEIAEYLIDYTDSDNGKITIKNLNQDIMSELDSEEEKSNIVQIVKDNIDKFSKKIITLEKENEGLIIKKVQKVET